MARIPIETAPMEGAQNGTADVGLLDALVVDGPAPESPSQLDQILAMLTDLTQRQTTIEQVVARQQTQMPQLKPMEHPYQRARTQPRVRPDDLGDMRRGDERAGDQQMPIGVNGRALDANLLRYFGQQLQAGDVVRIRREAIAAGSRTWGELLDAVNNNGIGTVLRACFVGRKGQWKYRVRIPGLTRKQGDGYLEDQLEAL